MYTPSAFKASNVEHLLARSRQSPLATIVVLGDAGLDVNHLPVVYDGDNTGKGTLRAHIPRANGLGATLETERDCVAIFHGPDGYVSPSWYATKGVDGKVVPTWNYAVVHVHGRVRRIDEPAWIREQLELLTAQSEATNGTQWTLDDAPREYTETLTKALVGVEISIEHLEGKLKASQNQPAENQRSILAAIGGDTTMFADLMRDTLTP